MLENSGLFENTKGAEEHERNVAYIREIVKEFAKFIMDKRQSAMIFKMDLPDYVQEFCEKADKGEI